MFAFRVLPRIDVSFAVAIAGLLFLAVACAQFAQGWGDAQTGLVISERTCPLAAPAVAARR